MPPRFSATKVPTMSVTWGVAIYGRDPAQDCGGIFYGGATGRGGGTHGHSNNILAATFEIEVLKTYKIEKALRKEPLKGNLRPPKTDFQDPFFSFFRRASVGVLKIAKNTVKPTKHTFLPKNRFYNSTSAGHDATSAGRCGGDFWSLQKCSRDPPNFKKKLFNDLFKTRPGDDR